MSAQKMTVKNFICFYYIGLIIYAAAKKYMYLYIYSVCTVLFCLLHGNCLNFLLWLMIFVVISYNVYERILINLLYQHAKIQRFFQIFRDFLCWYGNFCHFTAPFDDFPEYSGYSLRIQQIIDVFGIYSEPCCIL